MILTGDGLRPPSSINIPATASSRTFIAFVMLGDYLTSVLRDLGVVALRAPWLSPLVANAAAMFDWILAKSSRLAVFDRLS